MRVKNYLSLNCEFCSTPVFSPERTIEDHEYVMDVQSGRGMDTDSRLYFRKNYAKYEFFKKPLVSMSNDFTKNDQAFRPVVFFV